uniref:Uncharacterized protein n=1 Tax=Rhizophora mucronata TaxID=61149 RepID=A0A2P2P0U4_RHIMU
MSYLFLFVIVCYTIDYFLSRQFVLLFLVALCILAIQLSLELLLRFLKFS